MTNPLIAQRQSSTTWHSGINLVDDAAGLYDGVSSGNWIEGGLSAFGVGMDMLTVAMNPVGTLISYGLNWLIEHVQPLQDALNQLAGDADQIQAYSKTWGNIGKAVGQAATDLANAVKTDTAQWTGAAADAYRANVTDKINHLTAAATCANTISTVVEIVGVLTAAVRMIVRDMITQAVGDFIQDALEEVCSLGLGTPVVVAQVVEQVSEWITKITGVIKKLINSVEALRPLMSKLEEIWSAIQKVMNALHGHPSDDPHLPGGGDGTTPSSVTDPHGGGDTTTPSGTTGDPTTPASTPGEGTPTGSHNGTTTTTPSDAGGSPAPSNGTRPASSPDDGTGGGGGGQRSEGTGGCDGKGGDPVDVVSGQMITSKTDLELPGLLPMTLRRAYASDYRDGRLFGPGWSSTVDQRLDVDDLGIRYLGDDAQVLRYPRVDRPGEQVLPADGARWPLSWDRASDTYRIEDPETGWILHFGPSTDPGQRPLSALTDRHGHRVTYEHDANGMPVAVTHSGGYRVAVDVVDGPAGHRVAALRLLDGTNQGRGTTVVSYRYDRRGRLAGIVNASGLPYRYEYDDADRIIAWTDRNNYRYRYFYRADGRVVRGEGQGGFLNARFDYDLAGRVTTVTNSLGHATRYHYDTHNHLTMVVDPLGNTVRTEYDRYHRLLSVTDALGNTTRYVRDQNGDPIRIEFPDGTTTSIDYDARWRLPTTVTKPGGVVWRHAYSDTGSLLRTVDPIGAVTTSTLDDRGHLAVSTEPDGQRWQFTSDGAGRPLSITGPQGNITRYELDGFGRVVTTTDSRAAVTRYGWTVDGQLAWQAGPDGIVQETFYDAEGNVVENRNAVRGTTRFDVGPFNLPVARTGADGTRYTFAYDTELRLVKVTNPAGLTWDYEYDPAGNLVGESDFTGRRITYRCDAAGRQAARTEQAEPTVEYARDSMGRIIAKRVAGERATEFEYEPAGWLRRASDGTTELAYQRDLLGRPLVEAINGRALRSEYDLLGRRVRRWTPSGIETACEYTPLRKEAALSGTAGGLSFEYDSGGRETTRQLGGGTALTQAFDELGRLTAQSLWASGDGSADYRSIQQRTYTYRPDGMVISVGDRLRGDRGYQLTVAGRVTGVTGADWTERYAYDALGNVVTAQPGEPSDTAGGRVLDGFMLRNAGRSSYEYDGAGRLVREIRRTLSGQRRIWTYAWNSGNQLTTVTTPDGHRWRYTYDPLGRRTAKQRIDENGAVLAEVTFVWDGTNLAEQQHTMVDGDTAVVTATAWDYRGGTGEPIAQTTRSWLAEAPNDVIDTRFYAIVTDLVGTPTELVGPDGSIAWYQTTGLWGNQIAVSSRDGVDCPLRFPGQYHDPETDLHYNVHRYYDPRTARYLTPDPLGLPPSPNHYTYVPNPLTVCDPLGLNGFRSPNGQYASDPLNPPTGHNRSTEYPHDYWDSTHDTMATNWTLEGRAQGGVPVDASGVKIPRDQLTWVDAQGNQIPFDELTYDHNPPVVEHWNTAGYDQTKAQREAWYNKTDDMEAMTRSENSSKGAKLKMQYSDKAPGPNYSCS